MGAGWGIPRELASDQAFMTGKLEGDFSKATQPLALRTPRSTRPASYSNANGVSNTT